MWESVISAAERLVHACFVYMCIQHVVGPASHCGLFRLQGEQPPKRTLLQYVYPGIHVPTKPMEEVHTASAVHAVQSHISVCVPLGVSSTSLARIAITAWLRPIKTNMQSCPAPTAKSAGQHDSQRRWSCAQPMHFSLGQ
jgi:hypothetical protein